MEAERQRILSNEKTLQMRRKLDLLTTETELETAMKSELDGIRSINTGTGFYCNNAIATIPPARPPPR